MLLLERDPIFQNRNVCDLSRSEQREKAIQRVWIDFISTFVSEMFSLI